MRIFNKRATQRLRNATVEYGKMLAHPRHICGYWWHGTPNFGDVISPIILQWISGRTVPRYRGPVYLAVGSILDGVNIKNAVVWGSGFISSEGRMTGKPQQVLAVRGPHTRQNLVDQGVKCPEVYGDPGLLIRRLFDPPLTKEFEYGIVPHFKDKGMIPDWLAKSESIRLIDVQSRPSEFVRELCRCKRILSSSLHGLITADVFGIPSAQFCLPDRISGGGIFKFIDYFESVGRERVQPFDIKDIKEIESTKDHLVHADVEPAIRMLLDSSPFPPSDRPAFNARE
jgi:pyruvyltransferase